MPKTSPSSLSTIADDTLPTVLIHGLGLNHRAMYWLGRQLKRANFPVYIPHYYSLVQDIHHHSKRLNDYLQQHHTPEIPINIVAHSLGGLVARHFANHYPKWQIHACVTLGTPHQGSICADYAQRLIPTLVGKSYPNALDGRCLPLPANITLGAIAGDKSWGIGTPVLTYHNRHIQHHGKHDGTVYVFEALPQFASDTLVLPVTHSGLLFNKTVAQQVIYFLQHGCFNH